MNKKDEKEQEEGLTVANEVVDLRKEYPSDLSPSLEGKKKDAAA
jgi:hypothetical protein